MSDKLMNLYKQKGELITLIEVNQAKLQAVNKAIVESINASVDLGSSNESVDLERAIDNTCQIKKKPTKKS